MHLQGERERGREEEREVEDVSGDDGQVDADADIHADLSHRSISMASSTVSGKSAYIMSVDTVLSKGQLDCAPTRHAVDPREYEEGTGTHAGIQQFLGMLACTSIWTHACLQCLHHVRRVGHGGG